ncbi:Do family serine endopeptidase [Phyllobacterium sp. SYP-B3895]|jgi:serine protease Do|uniref:Probable periplasmic serine endoprotease DegP-like n=1 Tax=Phyllobacterium pellucidum TaxID=2740464 RepID=A0A849VK69_9HYPH|nr:MULTISPECIES: Do family serine endopeptidase [Phyllobacterium]MRG55959.1 Do family serine endopeptidase [Phyllobacterium sp. SYP-B3895]NTS30171.1 Do family serine endopeptidase [Phyllobacterium pellucidum]UGY11096.1 Do family serine endopeptidase [Phyllobacterium sp. T1018]SFI52193.1 serine protease Do [Phyllobacterium sp. CL33Tsu]
MPNIRKSSHFRKGIAAAMLSSALVGGFLATGPLAAIVPAQAEAVRVDAPQQPGFADVVEKVSPAVVSVRVKSAVHQTADDGSGGMPGLDQLPDDHPLKRFFYDFGGQGGQRMEPRKGGPRDHNRPDRIRPTAQGSGFFISEDGYLVTNNHVVEDGSAYSVVLNDGTELDAKLIGKDKRTDLAVLKVDDKRKFTYVSFGDDNKIRVGQWVVAVGNPFGLGGTVTAGIVSARGRDIGAGPYDDFLQIDAAVNRGNSGGPAFNLNGEVVGINTAIFSPSGGSVGIAFAIPSTTAKNVVDQLIKTGSVSRGWIGVQIQPVNKEIAESLGLAEEKGALVAEPQADGPAAKAGVSAGDVITAVNGETVSDPRDLAKKIAAINPGKDVELTVWRKGEAKSLNVAIKAMPGDDQLASKNTQPDQETAKPSALDDYGLTVMPSDDGKGVVVTDVDRQGDAADKGITTGDIIVSVNNLPVKSGADIETAITSATKAGRKAVLLQVQTNDQSRFVALPINQG